MDGSANAAARCIKRAAAMGAHRHMEAGHSTADRPVHRLLLQSCCSSPSLGTRSNWPAERNEPTAFYENAHTPGSSFSPEPEPTPSPIQTVAAVAERVVTPPAPAAACDNPFPQLSRLRRPHLRAFRPVLSPLPHRCP